MVYSGEVAVSQPCFGRVLILDIYQLETLKAIRCPCLVLATEPGDGFAILPDERRLCHSATVGKPQEHHMTAAPYDVAPQAIASPLRVDWVDYAKGICIVLVVMMHSTLGVEKAIGTAGYLGAFIEWARPFRMPDFFLISGLFLARRLHVPWRDYLDKKVLHFAYFYILWMTIQFAFKGYGIAKAEGPLGLLGEYALGFVQPFGTLWFIYLLAIFFVVTRLLVRVPPLLVFAVAALLEMAPIETGSLIIDEFASRYVYFFAGSWLASRIFASTAIMQTRNLLTLMAMLYIWATGHSLAMATGAGDLPVMSLVLGFAGAGAVITAAIVLARIAALPWLRYFGANSIVIYLAFFLPMAAIRTLGLKAYPAINPDILSALTTAGAIAGALLLYWLLRHSALRLLFVRPEWASLQGWQWPQSKTLSSKTVETPSGEWHSVDHDNKLQQRPQAR